MDKDSIVDIPEDFEFPKYDSIINKIPVIGVIASIEYLTTPLVECLKGIDTLPDNVRLLTSESGWKSIISKIPENSKEPKDFEQNGYKIHTHFYNNVCYAYVFKGAIEIPSDAKYNSIGLKIGSDIPDAGYMIKKKQVIDYGALYIASNSQKCIRINIPGRWSRFDKSYLYKGNETSEFS